LRGKVVLIHAFQMLCPACVMHAYAMQGTPTTLLIDRAGRLRKQGFGVEPDQRVIADPENLLAEPS